MQSRPPDGSLSAVACQDEIHSFVISQIVMVLFLQLSHKLRVLTTLQMQASETPRPSLKLGHAETARNSVLDRFGNAMNSARLRRATTEDYSKDPGVHVSLPRPV
jgi:hypothetical protein